MPNGTKWCCVCALTSTNCLDDRQALRQLRDHSRLLQSSAHLDVTHTIEVVAVEVFAIAHVAPQDSSEKRWA